MNPKHVLTGTAFLLLCSPHSFACKDADREQTARLQEHLRTASQICGESAASLEEYNVCKMDEFNFMAPEVNKLPESCQQILKKMVEPKTPATANPG